ncbi:MAG: hypothetical protein ACREIW_05685, partial [Chthoniobacterales bacterium]
MTDAGIPALVALIIQIILALVVFQANPTRHANQSFLFLSIAITGWLAAFFFGLRTNDPRIAELCIREASSVAALILLGLNFLRISIRERNRGWAELIRRSWIWVLIAVFVTLLCQTNLFLRGAHLPRVLGEAADPIYGPAFSLYVTMFVGAVLSLLIATLRDIRATTGSDRAELQFVLIAGILTVAASLPLTLVLGLVVPASRLISLSPFRVIIFSLVVAYGISTQKIMDVGALLRRVISYGLLTAYLLALYALVWWLVATVLHSSPQSHP